MKQNHTVTCLLFVSGILPPFIVEGRQKLDTVKTINHSTVLHAYSAICQYATCRTGLSKHLAVRLRMLIPLSDTSR
jgi:hypothetical protein